MWACLGKCVVINTAAHLYKVTTATIQARVANIQGWCLFQCNSICHGYYSKIRYINNSTYYTPQASGVGEYIRSSRSEKNIFDLSNDAPRQKKAYNV